jgi:hypothetical protein
MRRPNPKKLAQAQRSRDEAAAREKRFREVLATLPEPPPDPKRVTAPEEVAERQAAWAAWYLELNPEQQQAIRTAHNRASSQFIGRLPITR